MNIMQAAGRVSRLAAIAGALVAFSPAAYSQQPSAAATKDAKVLIAATGAANIFNPLIAGVVEQAKLLFLQQNPSLNKDLNEISQKIRSDLAPRTAELRDEMAKLYATHFTDQELKAMSAFYESPVGKKLLTQQPIVVDASMKFAQAWAVKLSDQVIATMREELKKRGRSP
jgi:hypothetical protein